MNRNEKTKFKLPPIRPERQDIHAVTSVTECEASISIPRDIVRLNPELDFIMEQQRNLDLCHRLGRKRYYGDIFRQKLDLQWRRLEYHELSFQRTIIAHNRFLRKNLEKRERALLKMQTDQELTKKREKDVKSLKHKYEFLNAVMIRMRKEIKRHCIYEDYVNSVVELDESPFKNDYEFIAKYESLQLVKEHCMVRQNEEMATAVLLHDANVEFFRLQDVVLIELTNFVFEFCASFYCFLYFFTFTERKYSEMRDQSDPKWKLPNMALKNLNPKYLQVTPHSEVHIPQDEPRRDSSIWYMKVNSKLSKVEGHLSHKRTRYQGVIHRLSNQWINLVRSENHFRSLVISHNKFVRENMEKRQRAITRVQQSQRLIQVRQAEIKDLKHETDVARFLLTEMRREIEKHDKYDVFLTNLISLEHCPFRTVFDILKKYEMLQLVKAQREQEQSREMARVVRAHKHMKMMIYNGNVLVIGLRNGLNNVRCKFDDICRKNLATESLITSIVNRTNEISAEVSTCQYMIDAMYRYMCMRRKLPLLDLPLRDVKPKVDILKSTLAGWEKILSTADITIKGKKKRKGSRKSYAWKQSVSQGVFNWKKKPTPEAEMFQNLMMNSSLFKP